MTVDLVLTWVAATCVAALAVLGAVVLPWTEAEAKQSLTALAAIGALVRGGLPPAGAEQEVGVPAGPCPVHVPVTPGLQVVRASSFR